MDRSPEDDHDDRSVDIKKSDLYLMASSIKAPIQKNESYSL
jgi:hypothetical protein